MKVLVITKTMAEFANIQGKLCEIPRHEINLTVVSPRRWHGSDKEIRKVEPRAYTLMVRNCRLSGTVTPRIANHLHFYPQISEVIEREEWDLVHIDEEPYNLVTYHTLRACMKRGRPAIFTTWQNLMKHYPPPFNFFERFAYKNADGAIAANSESLQVLRHRGFNKRAAYIPQLGVDPSIFCRRDATPLRRKLNLKGSFAVGFVGRFSPEKGIDTLFKAMALLPKECILVVVGNGPQRPMLEAMAEDLHLSSRVRWIPWVDPSAIPDYMNAFDVLVLPSRTRWNIKEQFGRVLVEAMACETCVVGSDSGEIPYVIGNAGLVFHEGNAQELARHLRHLMEDPLLRERLTRRGKERVADNFTYLQIARDTAEFYKSFCSGTPPPHPGRGEAQIFRASEPL